jgi:hypothetical protein
MIGAEQASEVLILQVEKLRRAKWMIPLYNLLTAPRLYRRVKIDGLEASPRQYRTEHAEMLKQSANIPPPGAENPVGRNRLIRP